MGRVSICRERLRDLWRNYNTKEAVIEDDATIGDIKISELERQGNDLEKILTQLRDLDTAYTHLGSRYASSVRKVSSWGLWDGGPSGESESANRGREATTRAQTDASLPSEEEHAN